MLSLGSDCLPCKLADLARVHGTQRFHRRRFEYGGERSGRFTGLQNEDGSSKTECGACPHATPRPLRLAGKRACCGEAVACFRCWDAAWMHCTCDGHVVCCVQVFTPSQTQTHRPGGRPLRLGARLLRLEDHETVRQSWRCQ